MRLVQPWAGSGRIVVGDSWFGSLRTAVALRRMGLYTVANVKTASKGFPKDRLLDKVLHRDDRCHMELRVPDDEWTYYGSAHRDVKPMALVHTCLTSHAGQPRTRTFRWWDESSRCIRKRRYTLE